MGALCCREADVAQSTGNRLGGNETHQGHQDARAAAAAAAEQRLNGSTGRSKPKAKYPKPTPKEAASTSNVQLNVNDTASSKPSQNRSSSRNSASEAADAAERRLEKEYAGLSAEKAAELKERREKDILVGKIQHYYQQAGKEAPFGLSSSSITALKKHLEYAKNLSR